MIPPETCEHLVGLERALRARGVPIVAEGETWFTRPARGRWIYFRCILDPERTRREYDLPSHVEYDEYDGRAAGHEAGFHCVLCESAVVGGHPAYGAEIFFPEDRRMRE